MYKVGAGTVQPVISEADEEKDFCCLHFGRAEYDRALPILTDYYREKGQEICDLLNTEKITIAEAKQRLSLV